MKSRPTATVGRFARRMDIRAREAEAGGADCTRPGAARGSSNGMWRSAPATLPAPGGLQWFDANPVLDVVHARAIRGDVFDVVFHAPQSHRAFEPHHAALDVDRHVLDFEAVVGHQALADVFADALVAALVVLRAFPEAELDRDVVEDAGALADVALTFGRFVSVDRLALVPLLLAAAVGVRPRDARAVLPAALTPVGVAPSHS